MDLQSKSVGSPDVLLNELVFILGQLSQKGNKKKIKLKCIYSSNMICFKIANFQNMLKC